MQGMRTAHRRTDTPSGGRIDFILSRDFNASMTATLEQTRTDLLRLIELAQRGEEVVITQQGQAIARLTAVPPTKPPSDRKAWLAKLARLRESTATEKTTPTTEEILEHLRAERG